MIMIQKTTTRNVHVFDARTGTVSMEGPKIDTALSAVAMQGYGYSDRFSGQIETVWNGGTLRRPQLRGWSNEDRRRYVSEPLAKLLPEKFTGKALFRLNGGELSGKPILTTE